MSSSSAPPVGRLAPSPTGALHLGNVRTFMIAWLSVRSRGGTLRMRIEDIDHPKHKAGSDAEIPDILAWLGFDWDGPIVRQSERTGLYSGILNRLKPRLYPCYCSRADIVNAASAPHPGEILRYPGTCRDPAAATPPHATDAVPAWRYALNPDETGRFTDRFCGPWTKSADSVTGDFVVARGTFPAYVLAVVADDIAMGMTEVIRGDDILPATTSQAVLYRALGATMPEFCHIPLVVGPDGRRLAKRHGDTRIAAYREAGITPGRILSALARSCGWLKADESVCSLAELLPRYTLGTVPREPFVWDDSLL